MPAKRSAPKRPQRRNRQTEVIDAAIEVFFRNGYAAASIQDVADKVGVLKGSLYYYIESKEDLLFQILDESHRQASKIVEETKALDLSALDRLCAYFERYLLWYLHNLERVSIYFSEWRHLTGKRLETIRRQRRTYENFVRDMVIEAQDVGDVVADINPKYFTFFLLGSVNAVPRWYRRDGADSPEFIAHVFTRLIRNVLTGDGKLPEPLLELGALEAAPPLAAAAAASGRKRRA
jgi:AcrR family transcriptional regulator